MLLYKRVAQFLAMSLRPARVRKAGASRIPTLVTDRGIPIAVLANPTSLKSSRRQRTLLPEYAALLKKGSKGSVLEDLEAVRGDR